MTSTKILVDNKKYSSLPYFAFYLRQNWQQLVLFLIIALFVILLPAYVMIQNEIGWIERGTIGEISLTQSDIIKRTESNMRDMSVVSLFVSAGLAVISGMSAMSYVNSKKSVGCYHSFPIKRESYFVIETVTPAIYYILATLTANLLCYLMFLVSVDGATEYASKFFAIMLVGILLYFFIYAGFLLAGGITGTHVMKFIVFLIIMFLPVAVYLMTFGLLCDNSELYSGYYIYIDVIRFMSPFVNLIYYVATFVEGGEFNWIFAVLSSVVMYAGALILTKFRKSEHSGTTVIWKPVFAIIKYAMIFSAAFLGTLIGYFIDQNNPVTMFCGMVFGGLIGLVLMNCIMYRSTRAMFKDFKKFVVCMVATLVFIVLIPMNITGLIGKPYSASFTKSISIDVNDGVVFTDKDEIEAILALEKINSYVDIRSPRFIYSDDEDTILKLAYDFDDYVYKETVYAVEGHYTSFGEYYDEYGSRVYENDREPEKDAMYLAKYKAQEIKSYFTNNRQNYVMVQKPKFGIPLVKYVHIDVNSTMFDTIINSDEYVAQFNMPSVLEDATFRWIEFNVFGYNDELVSKSMSFQGDMFEDLVNECVYDPAKRENSVLVGWIHFYTDNGIASESASIFYPIYSADVKLLNSIGEIFGSVEVIGEYDWAKYGRDGLLISSSNSASLMPRKEFADTLVGFRSEDDVIDFIAGDIYSVALVNAITNEAVIVDGAEDIKTLIKASSAVNREKWSVVEFAKSAYSDYVVIISYGSGYSHEISFRPDGIEYSELVDMFDRNK